MENLTDIIQDQELIDNIEKTVIVLRKLSLVTSDIETNQEEIIHRISYKTNIDKEFVKIVLDSIPGNKSKEIRKMHVPILKEHRKIVSEKINKRLSKYWSSEEFLKIKKMDSARA